MNNHNSNHKLTRKAQKEELIERLGVTFEKDGMQPTAARIVALLFVSDETELSFDEIRQQLNISKASTSLFVNMLLQMNTIEYITKPNDRKRYFRMRVNDWEDKVQEQINETLQRKEIFRQLLTHRPKSTESFNRKVLEITAFMDFLCDEMDHLMVKWNQVKPVRVSQFKEAHRET